MWFWGRKDKKETTDLEKSQIEKNDNIELETASEIELEQAVSNSETMNLEDETDDNEMQLEVDEDDDKINSELISPVEEKEIINQELVDLIDGLKNEEVKTTEKKTENGYDKYREKLQRIIKG